MAFQPLLLLLFHKETQMDYYHLSYLLDEGLHLCRKSTYYLLIHLVPEKLLQNKNNNIILCSMMQWVNNYQQQYHHGSPSYGCKHNLLCEIKHCAKFQIISELMYKECPSCNVCKRKENKQLVYLSSYEMLSLGVFIIGCTCFK